MRIQTSLNTIEVQLSNRIVTTPCELRLSEDSVHVCFDTPDGRLDFEFVLSNHELRLVLRDMQDTVELSVVPLYHFAQPNPRLHLTRAAGALESVAELGAGK